MALHGMACGMAGGMVCGMAWHGMAWPCRQKKAKQTNAQTQARQPSKQMVETAGRRLLSKQQKAT